MKTYLLFECWLI